MQHFSDPSIFLAPNPLIVAMCPSLFLFSKIEPFSWPEHFLACTPFINMATRPSLILFSEIAAVFGLHSPHYVNVSFSFPFQWNCSSFFLGNCLPANACHQFAWKKNHNVSDISQYPMSGFNIKNIYYQREYLFYAFSKYLTNRILGWTRISEYKHSPNQPPSALKLPGTVIYREYR